MWMPVTATDTGIMTFRPGVILLRAPTLGTNRKPRGRQRIQKHIIMMRRALLIGLIGGIVFWWCSPALAQLDPSVFGRWSSAPQLPWFPTAAHMLPTGQVLIYSGDPEGIPPGVPGTTQLLWSPSSGTTTSIPGSGYDLFCSGHSFLADGRLLFAGGHTENFVGLRSASTYDPFANTWTRLPDMNAGRWYPTSTTLSNGDALVVSGSIDNTVGVNRLPQVFQAASGTWRDLTTALLGLELYPQMHLAPNGKVFSVAPSEVTRYLDAAGTGAWSFVANRNSGYRDYGSSVLYADGKVLHLGGGDPPTNAAEVIDLNQAVPTWRSVPPMAIARRQANATILPDGKVLVTGGTSGPGFNNPTTPVFEAEMWDPTTEAWTTMAAAQVPRLYHSVAVLLPDGRIFSAGGNGYSQVEIYEPPYLFKGARPTITLAPASVSHGQTFFVETPQAADIAAVTWIRLPSVTHAFNQNQRINRLGFSQTKGGLNVTAPQSPNLAPPGHYMLFILNSNGVPSIAKIVRIDVVDSTPILTSLAPTSTPAGGAGFTLTVNGSNFVATSQVRWNGAARTTTFVNAGQVTAAIPASDIVTQGSAQVTVVNPAPGGASSNVLTFTISAPANPVPALTSLAPTSTAAGGRGVHADGEREQFRGDLPSPLERRRADDDVCERGPGDGGDSGERHRHPGERAGDGGESGARRGDLERLVVHHQRAGEPGAGAHLARPDEHAGRGGGVHADGEREQFRGDLAGPLERRRADDDVCQRGPGDGGDSGERHRHPGDRAGDGGESDARLGDLERLVVHHQRAGEPGTHVARPDEHAGRGGRLHADGEREQFRGDLPSPLERRRADDDVCERGPGDGGDSGERHRHPGERAGDGGESDQRLDVLRGGRRRVRIYRHRGGALRGQRVVFLHESDRRDRLHQQRVRRSYLRHRETLRSQDDGCLERLDVHHQRRGEPGAGAHLARADEHAGRGDGFTLTVNGSNFVGTSQVRWNGAARTTTFVNAGQVTAAIPASDIVTAGERAGDGGESGARRGDLERRVVHHQRGGEPGAGAHVARADEHGGRGAASR